MASLKAFPSRVPIVEIEGDLSAELARFQRRLDREAAKLRAEAWLLRLLARAGPVSDRCAFRLGLAGERGPPVALSLDLCVPWARGRDLRRRLAARPLVTWMRRR